jgi:hypothetical protein
MKVSLKITFMFLYSIFGCTWSLFFLVSRISRLKSIEETHIHYTVSKFLLPVVKFPDYRTSGNALEIKENILIIYASIREGIKMYH